MSLTDDLNGLRTLMVTNLTNKGATADNTMGLTTLANKIPTISGGGGGETITPDYYVSTTGSDSNDGKTETTPFLTINKAITKAVDGNSILILAGTYSGKGTNTDLTVSKNLKIYGEDGTTLDGLNTGRSGFVVANDAKCLFQNIIFTNGLTYYGSNFSLQSHSSVIIKNCTFNKGTIYFYNTNGNTIIDCSFNNSTNDPISMYSSNSNNITNCTFSNNTPDVSVIYMESSNSNNITNCSFNNNTLTSGYGAGIKMRTSSYNNIDSCTFTGNTAKYDGGALYISEGGSNIIFNCIFDQNSTTNSSGGAIYLTGTSSNKIDNCKFTNNTSGDYGGVLFITGGSTLNEINDCIFDTNTSVNGSGVIFINSGCPSNITYESEFLNNTCSSTTNSGGAFFIGSETCNVSNCAFSNNKVGTSTIRNFYCSGSISGTVNYCSWDTTSPSSSIYGRMSGYTVSDRTPPVSYCTKISKTRIKVGDTVTYYVTAMQGKRLSGKRLSIIKDKKTLADQSTTDSNGCATMTITPLRGSSYCVGAWDDTKYAAVGGCYSFTFVG